MPVLGIAILGLLIWHAGKIEWEGAFQALRRYAAAVLMGALGLAVASHALYGVFDLIGRAHTRHGLGRVHTWAIAVASYAFNLNLGSLIGGVGLRVRLYLRAGLDEATVAQVVGLSLATNWLGYGLLAGALYAAGLIEPPAQAGIRPEVFRLMGAAMVALAAAYVVACARMGGRQWRIARRQITFPSARIAAVQLAVSAANWGLMGSVMYLLLGEQVSYGTTLSVLMAASIVGVVTPIPAGLGVLEAVYLALLSGQVKQGALLGAVLAYRMVYYVFPLATGLVLYFFLERHAKDRAAQQPSAADPAAAEVPALGRG